MGYGFRINAVDFSDVALDQVNFVEVIPCTGITLNQNSIIADKVEDSIQLTATVTPSNTSDRIIWSSSDDDVASVVDGLVTIHGIGTAVITAACGTQTATATVNQVRIKSQDSLKIVSDMYPATLQDDEISIIGLESITGQCAIGQHYHANNIHLKAYNGRIHDFELIPVPYGATRVKIATTDGQAVQLNYIIIADTNDIVVFQNSNYPKYLRQGTFFNTETGFDVEYGEAITFRKVGVVDTLDYVYFE